MLFLFALSKSMSYHMLMTNPTTKEFFAAYNLPTADLDPATQTLPLLYDTCTEEVISLASEDEQEASSKGENGRFWLNDRSVYVA